MYISNQLISLFWDQLVVAPSSTRGLSPSLLIALNCCMREVEEISLVIPSPLHSRVLQQHFVDNMP